MCIVEFNYKWQWEQIFTMNWIKSCPKDKGYDRNEID